MQTNSQSDILEQRRIARASKRQRDLQLLEQHRKVAAILQNEQQAELVRQQALQRVDKWEKEQLCHMHYIQAWRNILTMPVNMMVSAILDENVEGVSLRQNSPFGFLLQ